MLRTIALLALLLGLAGCDSIYTDNPIGTAPQTEIDASLTGGWEFVIPPNELKKSPGQKVYCFFLPAKDGGFRGVLVSWSSGSASDSSDTAFDAVTGKTGDQWFLNVRNVFDEGKTDNDGLPGYRPFRYRVNSDGSLDVFDWSPEGLEKLKADVERGRIRGTVTIGSAGTDVSGKPINTTNIQINADQQSLDAYFAENATRIFDKPLVTLHRMRDR